jgi:hypothetical protein
MFTREEVERAILTEENGWRELFPSNSAVLDALDNVRMHLGLPRYNGPGMSLRKAVGFNGKSQE